MDNSQPAATGMDGMQTAVNHLSTHISYPATAEELKKACNGMEDVPENERREFIEKLPDGTYNSAEDVMKAVGWM
jgi:hypothetical protein